MKRRKTISIIFIFTIAIIVVLIMVKQQKNKSKINTQSNTNPIISQTPDKIIATNPAVPTVIKTTDPLPNALSRITKKPFGIYVTPNNSPVSPEKFTGYHTGIDLETTPDEQNINVVVKAVCDGKLLLSKWASGYGGVAVQSCTLNNQAVTIIYGHLYVNSIIPKVNDSILAGEQIAILGQDYSQQTDGERKHLHLGIHIGTSINILGYVQNKIDLQAWLDPVKFLQ